MPWRWRGHLRRVLNAKGCVVPGLGNRRGDRADRAVDPEHKNWGGKRVKGPAMDPGQLHNDAKPAAAKRQKTAVDRRKS